MPTITFAVPIARGQSDAFRAAHQRFAVGRRVEFEASRRRLGIVSERGFLQRTPAGDLAVLLFEVEDPARMFTGLASSHAPVDIEFRRYVLDTFGVDLTRPPAEPPAESVFDWRSPGPPR